MSIATASNNLRSIPGASINYTGVFTFCPMGSIPCAGTFRISRSLWCERILCVCSWSWWKGNRSSLGVVCFQLTLVAEPAQPACDKGISGSRRSQEHSIQRPEECQRVRMVLVLFAFSVASRRITRNTKDGSSGC